MLAEADRDGPPPSPTALSLRARVYRALDPRSRRDQGLSAANAILITVILLASLLAILETEPLLIDRFERWFDAAELAFGLLFTAEYAVRLWTAPERQPGQPAWRQRLLFVVSPVGLADVLVIVASLAPAVSTSLILLRWIRLARILRLAKLGRTTRAMDYLVEAIKSRRAELGLSLLFGLVLMVVSATALYAVEGTVQPDKFGSIPRALWWSVATLTTIGYGDVYPITALGKVLAAITAIFSIGLIAMPTGILAAAFSDAMARHRELENG